MTIGEHPSPRVYWLLLRWLVGICVVLIVAFAAWGLSQDQLSDGQREILTNILSTFGWVVMLWVSLSQGQTAVESIARRMDK